MIFRSKKGRGATLSILQMLKIWSFSVFQIRLYSLLKMEKKNQLSTLLLSYLSSRKSENKITFRNSLICEQYNWQLMDTKKGSNDISIPVFSIYERRANLSIQTFRLDVRI